MLIVIVAGAHSEDADRLSVKPISNARPSLMSWSNGPLLGDPNKHPDSWSVLESCSPKSTPDVGLKSAAERSSRS